MATEAKSRPWPPIAIEPHQWEELSAIMQTHVPGRKIWAFGSRATGERVRRFSDLDLAIGGEELPLELLDTLREALDESRLPFKVDIVDLAAVTPEFRARIEPEMVLVQEHALLHRAAWPRRKASAKPPCAASGNYITSSRTWSRASSSAVAGTAPDR